jgi:proteasome lid subunit RPN8/RPN11
MTRSEPEPRLDSDALAMVATWQRAAGPREVCGLCAVDAQGVQHVLPLTNHAGLAGEFEVCRSEEEVVRAAAAQRGWTIVAFLHTHPQDEPEMSPRDASTFERDKLPWIIVGTPTVVPRQRGYSRPAGSPRAERPCP